jgi:hypothetical protein
MEHRAPDRCADALRREGKIKVSIKWQMGTFGIPSIHGDKIRLDKFPAQAQNS